MTILSRAWTDQATQNALDACATKALTRQAMNSSEDQFSLNGAASKKHCPIRVSTIGALLAVAVTGWCTTIEGAPIHDAAESGDLGKVKAYLSHSPKALSGLRAAAAEGSIEAVRMAAHSLKSSSANLGAASLTALFKTLEHQATAGNAEAIAPLVAQIIVEFAKVRAELEVELAPSDQVLLAAG